MFLLVYVVFLLICHTVRVREIVHLLSIDMSKKISFGVQLHVTIGARDCAESVPDPRNYQNYKR